MSPYVPAVSVALLLYLVEVGVWGGIVGVLGIYGLGICVSPPIVGCPVSLIASGHPVVPGGNVEATIPLTEAEIPSILIPPFAPTFPLVFVWLLGGLVGVPSVDELKLPVMLLPFKSSGAGLHPVPVANSPPGEFEVCGVCAISACTRRRVPLVLTASEVSR